MKLLIVALILWVICTLLFVAVHLPCNKVVVEWENQYIVPFIGGYFTCH